MTGPVSGLGVAALPGTVQETPSQGSSGDGSRASSNGNTTRRLPITDKMANAWWEEAVRMIMAQKGVSRKVAEAEANTY
jgi:hypothetical protein